MNQEEKEKLATLLGYWLEHNREHRAEFCEWADKASAAGAGEVAAAIRQAGEELEKANELLAAAKKKLAGKK
ncbi:MAG: hypothetical protein ABID87_03180 [Chloroflexota bacterium]